MATGKLPRRNTAQPAAVKVPATEVPAAAPADAVKVVPVGLVAKGGPADRAVRVVRIARKDLRWISNRGLNKNGGGDNIVATFVSSEQASHARHGEPAHFMGSLPNLNPLAPLAPGLPRNPRLADTQPP